MTKFSNTFFVFLKICITVALVALLLGSVGTVFIITPNGLDLNLSILMICTTALSLLVLFSKIKHSYKIILILIFAFIVRLLWTLNINSVPVSDFATMYSTAQNLLQGNKETLRGLGYLSRFPHLVPMMLYMAGMIKLFGSFHIVAIKIVALLLSVLNVYLIYVLASYYVKTPFMKLTAMIIATIFPPFISYCSTFCTETIGITLFLLSTIIFHKAVDVQSKKPLWFLLCGVCLYASNMFRGIGIIFLIALVMYILIFTSKKKTISIAALLAGYMFLAVSVSSVLMATEVIERPLWKGTEPGFVTLMLKGSNFEHHGMWNPEDAQFVDEHLTSDNLSEECFKIIKQRLSEKSLLQIVGFYASKFFSQWIVGDCMGTFWATNTTFPSKFPVPLTFQIIHCALLFFSIFIFSSKNEKKTLALPCILLWGFGVIFIILETQSRYSLIVSWVFILLASMGLENLKFSENFFTDLKNMYTKNTEAFRYLFFGAVTTFVNIITYFITYNLLHIPNVISTIIAWIISVIVAYITNKLWVFESKSFESKVLIKEVSSFFSCRLLTGILDVAIMWICVDLLLLNSTVIKILSNIIVIIANYAVSKMFIFKKEDN